jgi:hypothetical protein
MRLDKIALEIFIYNHSQLLSFFAFFNNSKNKFSSFPFNPSKTILKNFTAYKNPQGRKHQAN